MPSTILSVKKPSTYDILIENGSINRVGKIVAKSVKGKNCLIVTDTNVEHFYLDIVTQSLEKEGFNLVHFKTNILRAETASLYGIATIQTAFTELDEWHTHE